MPRDDLHPAADRNDLDVDPYPRMSRRRRLLIALLAIATAVTVVLMLLRPPAGSRRPAPAPCASGQTSGCIGGKADVIVVPAPAPASH